MFGLPFTARSLRAADLRGASLHPGFFMNNAG
jgi:hypothetical protein